MKGVMGRKGVRKEACKQLDPVQSNCLPITGTHSTPKPTTPQAKYCVDEVHYTSELSAVLKAAQPPCIHVLAGTNTDRCVSNSNFFEV